MAAPAAYTSEAKKLRTAAHRAIAAVTEALGNFTFNIAVARIYELAGALAGPSPTDAGLLAARFEAMSALTLLVAPMMPHLAEEIFSVLHPGAGLAVDQPWPVAEAALLVADEVTIAVQVNGKLRGTFLAPAGMAAAEAFVIAKQTAKSALGEQTIVKEIYVPDRIVNFVVKP